MQDEAFDVRGLESGEESAHYKKPSFHESLGLSERFLEMGTAAGFDMSSLAGVANWFCEYKRRIMEGQTLEVTLPQAEQGQATRGMTRSSQSPGRFAK